MIVLVLDIETTGLSKSEHTITVIGTIVYESLDDTTTSEKCYNVALAASSGSDALLKMKRDIERLLDDAETVVAFNGINFDMPFILKWLHASPSNLVPPPERGERDATPPVDKTVGRKRKLSPDIEQPDKAPGALDVHRWEHKYLDFCRVSRDYTGSYISLNNVCVLNKIDVAKSGSGLQAVQWAAEKNWASLESYCMQDVVVLLALTKHAIRHGITLRLRAYGKRGKKNDNIVVHLDAKMRPFVPQNAAVVDDIFDTSSPKTLDFGG